MNNTLIDAWFTVEQLKIMCSALKTYQNSCEYIEGEELNPIVEHLEHLIEHYHEARTTKSAI